MSYPHNWLAKARGGRGEPRPRGRRKEVVEAGDVRMAGEGSGRGEPRSSGYGLLGHPKRVIHWRRPRRGAPGYLSPIVMFMYPRTRMTCSTEKSRARGYFVIVIFFLGFSYGLFALF